MPAGSGQSSSTYANETFDDKDAGWTWKNMEEYDDPYLFGKSGHAGPTGSYGQFPFHGTGIKVFGMAAPSIPMDGVKHAMGSAIVWVDGKQVCEVPVNTASEKYRYVIAKVDGLPDTDHILLVEPAAGWIVVDYVEVTHSPSSGVSPQMAQADPPASPASNVTVQDYTGPIYQIIPSGADSKCLDIPLPNPGSSLVGQVVDLSSPTANRLQLWHITGLDNGRSVITPVGHPEVALTIDQSPGVPSILSLQPNSGKADQEIMIGPTGEDLHLLSSVAAPKSFMWVEPGAASDGEPVICKDFGSDPGYGWELQVQVQR
jgi:hypothetical protein